MTKVNTIIFSSTTTNKEGSNKMAPQEASLYKNESLESVYNIQEELGRSVLTSIYFSNIIFEEIFEKYDELKTLYVTTRFESIKAFGILSFQYFFNIPEIT